jgi:hypothetical protein
MQMIESLWNHFLMIILYQWIVDLEQHLS